MTISPSFKSLPLGVMCAVLPLACLCAQERHPIDQTRDNLRVWLETAQKHQTDLNQWELDQEILTHYKEGLENEAKSYRSQIDEARTRAAAADQQSTDQITQRDQFIAAEKLLSKRLREMEEQFAKIVPLLPAPMTRFPKISVAIETLQKNLAQPADQQTDDVGKRLANLTELMAEAEKFQQGVNVHQELHKNSKNQEFNMQVVYFGLAAAYAVNETDTFALVGRPTPGGWLFTEQNNLAKDIRKLVVTATTEKDVSFTHLPLPKR